jgi:Late embryogenesis abundant protein
MPYYYGNSNPTYHAYPNPNPNPSYPAAYYQPSRRNAFLRIMVVIAIAFLLAMGAATFITWLVLRPQLPVFSVSSASVSSFNISTSTSVSLDLSLTFTVQNPNQKLSISYADVSTDINYRGETLADTNLSPFYQPKENSTQFSAHLVAVGQYVSDDVTKGVQLEKGKDDGGVHFQVRFFSWAVFNSGAWRTRRYVLRVYCDDVIIGLSSSNSSTAYSGKLLGTPKTCTVNI